MQPAWLLTSVLATGYLTLFLMERLNPLRTAVRSLWPRVLVNVVVAALALAAGAITVEPAVSYVLGLPPEREIGLLALFDLPVAVEFGIAFLLFDWSFYWWHRLHHSLRLNVRQKEIEVGVPGYSLPEDNRLWRLLSMPFRRQRAYWLRPDGTEMETRPAATEPEPTNRMQE